MHIRNEQLICDDTRPMLSELQGSESRNRTHSSFKSYQQAKFLFPLSEVLERTGTEIHLFVSKAGKHPTRNTSDSLNWTLRLPPSSTGSSCQENNGLQGGL